MRNGVRQALAREAKAEKARETLAQVEDDDAAPNRNPPPVAAEDVQQLAEKGP